MGDRSDSDATRKTGTPTPGAGCIASRGPRRYAPRRMSGRGYRWPAEWEPHRATWLSWPHNPETWPGRLDRAEAAFCAIVRALEGRETACINEIGRASCRGR